MNSDRFRSSSAGVPAMTGTFLPHFPGANCPGAVSGDAPDLSYLVLPFDECLLAALSVIGTREKLFRKLIEVGYRRKALFRNRPLHVLSHTIGRISQSNVVLIPTNSNRPNGASLRHSPANRQMIAAARPSLWSFGKV